MSKITISEASRNFSISRATIYKKIKKNQITKDSNGLLDTMDCIRIFGDVHTNKSKQHVGIKTGSVETELEFIKRENQQLKQQLDQLQKQLDYSQSNESWLKTQLEQRLIEYQSKDKQSEPRKGLIGRLFG